MPVNVPYGNSRIPVDVPEKNLMVARPGEAEKTEDEGRLVAYMAESIKDIVEHTTGKTLIIVNDGQRATPTRRVLEAIGDYLVINRDRVIIEVATGTHPPPSSAEMRDILGSLYDSGLDVEVHDCRGDEMVFYGTTTRGTPVYINAVVENADSIVCINSVEPHYFAGFTGGRKSILPGIAAYETVEKNHSLALLPDARVMALEGNPVHEDMVEGVSMMERYIYGVQMVLSGSRIVHAAVGELGEAFSQCVEVAREIYSTPVEAKADIVVTAAATPLDRTLYQAQKAIENIKNAVKEGGSIVLVSECGLGIGNRTFYDLLSAHDSADEVLREIAREYRLGYHKAAKIAEASMRYKLYAHTSLDDYTVRKAHLEPLHDINNYISEYLRENPEARVLVVPDGTSTIPVPEVR